MESPLSSKLFDPSKRHFPLRMGGGSLVALAVATCLGACAPDPYKVPDNAILIGAVLPFTGREAAVGRNIEQALILAAEDINRAGGIDGRPIEIVGADSNSGSERGFNNLLDLIYNQQLSILIGPEENDLANRAVPDIKGLNVLNVLPGYAAPDISRTEASGAWLRLAPNAWHIGCAMSKYAAYQGQPVANALVALDDYDSVLSTVFSSSLTRFGGTSRPSITVDPSDASYSTQISRAFSQSTDGTALLAYPTTASRIITEWTVEGSPGTWFLSPMLRTQALLDNVPYGSLNGFWGVSPSLSLSSECTGITAADNTDINSTVNEVACTTDNAALFARHFTSRWDGTAPFAASRFYYDAVVLLAMGMQYSLATQGEIPAAPQLQEVIRSLNAPANAAARWDDLNGAMAELASGQAQRYVGVGAEYQFDRFGAADYSVFDIWGIENHSFANRSAFYAVCSHMK